ncbi:MAG: right-handed parallel beta-helix repeat-containing protein [Bacteroidetes bacterium]|nr:right-handed parallel beta-helix repeat-containing protein [Bacteroidota bacterium]
MKKKLLLLPFVLFGVGQCFGQTNLPTVLACNEILTLSGSPYIVDSTITIKPGCVLTVNAGVEIKMAENTHLIVQGKVDFLGTALQPILIHAKDTIWGNILLDSTHHLKSTFNYVNIENGRVNVNPNSMKAVIFAYFSSFEAKNCNFKNNLRCFYAYRSSNILIKNCVLDSTNRGEKILCQYSDQVTIDNCTLYNTTGDADVIDFDGSTNVIISNNLLCGGGDDAIDLGHAIDPNHPDSLGCTNVVVVGNVIYNFFNKAVSNGENAANININHNLMVNCGWGIGAKAGAHVIADHNTIYNCQKGVKAYDHYDGWGPGHLTVTNSIIVGCDTTWFRDSTATLSVSYSLSDSALISGIGNIQADPLFVSTSLITLLL